MFAARDGHRAANRAWRGAGRCSWPCVVLNASVTFHNVWPTLGVHWPGELSVEFSVLLLVLSLSNAWLGRTRPGVLALLSALDRGVYAGALRLCHRAGAVRTGHQPVLGRTAARMPCRACSCAWHHPGWSRPCAWERIGVLAVLYLIARWSLGQIDTALRLSCARPGGAAAAAALLLVACFFAAADSMRCQRIPRFSIPVSRTFAAQVARVADAVSGEPNRDVPRVAADALEFLPRSPAAMCCWCSWSPTAAPPMTGPSSSVHCGRHASGWRPRSRTPAAGVVSAYVSSPTFGGGSVLAHLSLLSGIEVRDYGPLRAADDAEAGRRWCRCSRAPATGRWP